MTSKPKRLLLALALILAVIFCSNTRAVRQRERTRLQGADGSDKPLRVVTTMPDYAALARIIGGDYITVEAIVHPVQDPHHIRPKPSFVNMVMQADMVISTGLDLEMWLPTVVNKSGNRRVRSGEIGYVAVAQGMKLLEKPEVLSQSEGDVHIYGNPHIMCSPINARHVAGNIAVGLIKNIPQHKEFFQKNLEKLQDELDRHLFGDELVKLLGGKTLCQLTEEHKLMDLLKTKEFQGKPLIDKLGGWMKTMLPLRGQSVVVYHKNWSYLLDLFGMKEAATIESKPGIPPSPKHVTGLIEMMRDKNIKIIFAANYFDRQKIKTIADRTGAQAIIAPLFVGGAEGIDDYFKLVDCWVNSLTEAAAK
ncbi:MAG: zinc ABC transporter substrate-binding protein [Sedimentisphaerales bacterium]|nr:zinc ABC transporter substrate-binding protein [Sedimentisphaerales bacterium]